MDTGPGAIGSRAHIIGQLVDYLTYRRECGDRTVEVDRETLAGLEVTVAGKSPAGRTSAPGTPRARRPAPAAPAAVPRNGGNVADCTAALQQIAAEAADCKRCILHRERQQVVPGQGNPLQPDIMFVGEAPGADEDRQGLAFVGRAGQLLTKMIEAMGYTREQVFIANICKCRPPGNRAPALDEMQACLPYLKRQIAIIKPRTIVAMGNIAILGLLNATGITRLRGHWTSFEGIPLMPTWHPAYLLRFPAAKRDSWSDLKKVLAKLGRPVPKPTRPAATAT
ncbi:MAG: uracil-DNA glycosylase [Kiritimatiellae bacterium]|nr:uracil-DNA glycosylase [Kiritimatiellia bacterium]